MKHTAIAHCTAAGILLLTLLMQSSKCSLLGRVLGQSDSVSRITLMSMNTAPLMRQL